MRELEKMTYEEVKFLYEMLENQLKTIELMCGNARFNDTTVSVEQKLANYLNAE